LGQLLRVGSVDVDGSNHSYPIRCRCSFEGVPLCTRGWSFFHRCVPQAVGQTLCRTRNQTGAEMSSAKKGQASLRRAGSG
jgi:hypothetical protein